MAAFHMITGWHFLLYKILYLYSFSWTEIGALFAHISVMKSDCTLELNAKREEKSLCNVLCSCRSGRSSQGKRKRKLIVFNIVLAKMPMLLGEYLQYWDKMVLLNFICHQLPVYPEPLTLWGWLWLCHVWISWDFHTKHFIQNCAKNKSKQNSKINPGISRSSG